MAVINGFEQKRKTLVADTEDEIQFSSGVQKISIVVVSDSMANNVYIKPVSNLVGVDAAAWDNDLEAIKLTPIVRSIDLYFAGDITSIFIRSAGTEEVQWYQSF